MKRGGPLKRTAWLRNRPAPRAEPPPRQRAPLAPLTRPVRYGAPANEPVFALKTVAQRNRRLLTLARGAPCLLRVWDVCCGDPATTVAAHSNWSIHGKAGARKADDHWTCWGCSTCHAWLDQGRATEAERIGVFLAGHRDQVKAWMEIAADPRRPEPDRAAAAWALALVAAEKHPANDDHYRKDRR